MLEFSISDTALSSTHILYNIVDFCLVILFTPTEFSNRMLTKRTDNLYTSNYHKYECQRNNKTDQIINHFITVGQFYIYWRLRLNIYIIYICSYTVKLNGYQIQCVFVYYFIGLLYTQHKVKHSGRPPFCIISIINNGNIDVWELIITIVLT